MENIKKFFHDPQKLYFLSVLNVCLALLSYYFLMTNKSLTEIYLMFAKHSYKVSETNINLIIFFSFFLCANLVSFICSCIYFQKSIRNINKKYSQVTTKIQEAEEELTKKDDEIADLQERLEAEEKWSNTLEKERDQHDFSHLEQTRALEKELAELEEENQGLRDEIERMEQQLAEKVTAQGVNAAQAEVKGRLKRLEKAIGMPEDWSQATERKYPPVVRVVGYLLQGKDREQIAAILASEKKKGTEYGQPVDKICFTQSQIDALLTEEPIEELSIPQIGVLIDDGGVKAADSYETSAKRAKNRCLKRSVPPRAQ